VPSTWPGITFISSRKTARKSLPESEEFLKADLTKDASKDLAYAEQVHTKDNRNFRLKKKSQPTGADMFLGPVFCGALLSRMRLGPAREGRP
jgi:hypothetical protein